MCSQNLKNMNLEENMNILFVFFGPSGGVETLNRQRSLALKKKNINCHFLYYKKQRDLVNNHYGPTFITNKDDEIKKHFRIWLLTTILFCNETDNVIMFHKKYLCGCFTVFKCDTNVLGVCERKVLCS